MASTSIPKMMRALIQPDPAEKHLVLSERQVPTADPNADEHLIRVHCVAPCSGELLWPKYFPPPKSRELISCFDTAGTVVTAPDSSPFRVGDEVYARTEYSYRPGCTRDYAIGVTDELAHRPKQLSWAESTAVPLSSQTAWQALFIHAGIGDFTNTDAWEGVRVLVTAASGSVGQWVTQLATLAGATVIGTCGPDNVERVRSLGANEVVNYRATDLREWSKSPGNKVDVVIDCIGKKSLEDAWWCVKDGGVVVSIFQSPKQVQPKECEGKYVKDIFFVMSPNRSHLEKTTKLIEEGKCRPMVDSVWPLEQFEEAFKRLDTGHAKGKIILDLSLNN